MTCPVMAGFEPLSQEFKRNPYPVLARARREHPVFYHPELDIWVVTRFDDAARVQGDWETFSQRAAGLVPVPDEVADRVDGTFFTRSLMASDPPTHTRSRKAVNQAFTRTRVAAMAPRILEIIDRLIDGFADRGSCDIVNDFSYPMGLLVVLGLLGLPDDEQARFTQTAEDLMVLVTPRTDLDDEEPDDTIALRRMSPEERVARWERMADTRAFLLEEVRARRDNPRDDLTTALVQATDADGAPAFEEERIVTHMIEIVTAGTDTTAQLTAHTIQLFDQHPDQLDLVLADPSLWENAVEEGLRRRGTNLGVFRKTTRDVKVAGVTIPARSLVWSLVGAAGHDDAHFAEPDRFDVRRPNASEHLSFGKGRHFCLGAPLARLEARLALQRLYERLGRIRLVPDQEIRYKPVLKNYILEAMQVQWDVR